VEGVMPIDPTASDISQSDAAPYKVAPASTTGQPAKEEPTVAEEPEQPPATALSDAGRTFITNREGMKLRAYKDKAGVWTIGFGHTGDDVTPTSVITKNQAHQLFKKDVRTVENAINKYVKVPLSQNEFDALSSFVYNVGIKAFKNSTLLQLLNNGDKEGAADQFLVWTKARDPKTGEKVQLKGLVRRRTAERDLFLNGTYSKP